MPANVQTMMYTGEKPWHGLGVELDKPATAREAIVAAGLEWEVDKSPVYLYNREKTAATEEIPGRFALVRRDTGHVFNVVQDSYKTIQNKEAFDFFDTVVGKGQAIYHTAGALGFGERVWILAKLPGAIEVVKKDVVEKYLLLATSHDGHSALLMMETPIRVVCQNTLNSALSAGQKDSTVKIRHSGDMMLKVQEAERVLGIAKLYYSDFEKAAKVLVAKQMPEPKLDKFLKDLFTGKGKFVENERETVKRLFTEGKGMDIPGVRGTAWAAYNAVAEYTDHAWKPRAKDDARAKSLRLRSVWFGQGASLKTEAMKLALAVR